MLGVLIEIMSLNDDETHKAAYPIQDGKFVLSEDTIAAREVGPVGRDSR
jgi:hypothetical protein